jgi:hypothetical protein
MKRLPPWLVVPLLVPAVVTITYCGRGALDYGSGQGAFRHSGRPGLGFANLDPASRAPSTSSGCLVSGGELFTDLPYNVALKTMGTLFGPMKGAYDGPYPSREEAWQLLEKQGAVIEVEYTREGMKIEGAPLPEELLDRALESRRWADGPLDFTLELRALVLEERLFLATAISEKDPRAVIVLTDVERDERIALYSVANPFFVPSAP